MLGEPGPIVIVASPNLYFVGYDIVATGLLRQIALEAAAVAADLARVRA